MIPGGADPITRQERELLSRRCACGGSIRKHRDGCDTLSALPQAMAALRDAFPGTMFSVGLATGDPKTGTRDMPGPVRICVGWRGGPREEAVAAVLRGIPVRDARLNRKTQPGPV